MTIARGLLAALAALALLASILLFFTSSRVHDPTFYADAITHTDALDAIEDIALETQLREPLRRTPIARHNQQLLVEEAEHLWERILPPNWRADALAHIIEQVLTPLSQGDEPLPATLALTLPMADRVEHAAHVLAERIPESEAFNMIYTESTIVFAREFSQEHPVLPLGIRAGPEETRDFILDTLPFSWMSHQIANTLDAAAPWLGGATPSFRYAIPLSEREEAVLRATETLLERGDSYDFLIVNVVTPAVHQNLDAIIQLPFGVKLRDADVIEAFRKVINESWTLKQKANILQQGTDYLTGRADRLVLEVDLADRKKAAMQKLTGLVDQRLSEALATMPTCTPTELLRAAALPDSPLHCSPPGSSLAASKAMLGFRVSEQIESKIGAAIPDRWVYDEAQMRARLRTSTWKTVQLSRRWLQTGIPVSDGNLKRLLSRERHNQVQDVLELARAGFSHQLELPAATHRDLIRAQDALDTLRLSRWLTLLAALLLLGLWIALRGETPPLLRARDAAILLAIAATLLALIAVVARALAPAAVRDAIPARALPAWPQLDDALPDFAAALTSNFTTGLLITALIIAGLAALSAFAAHTFQQKKTPS